MAISGHSINLSPFPAPSASGDFPGNRVDANVSERQISDNVQIDMSLCLPVRIQLHLQVRLCTVLRKHLENI